MFYTPLPSKTRILAQKAPVVTQKGLRWLTIISSIPLFGIVTAFGIAPTTSSLQDIPVRQIVHSLPLPEIAVTNEDENQYSVSTFWHQENIRRGDTIAAILSRLEVNKQDKADFIRAVRDNKVMQHLRSGEIIHAETSTEGELLTLRYFNIQGKQLNIGKIGSFYEIDNETAETNARIRVGSGIIQNTLFAA
ncbi:MAG TPA: M23 family peptidase, partial [Nitrosomonas sp.]|nr:M23 family peptidase [Nitrosomonas sp.]